MISLLLIALFFIGRLISGKINKFGRKLIYLIFMLCDLAAIRAARLMTAEKQR